MIDALPAPLAALVTAPSGPLPGANGSVPGAAAGDFAQTLGAFLDARDAPTPPPALAPDSTGRQALADYGTEMPDAPANDPASSTDNAAAWIAALSLPLPQLPPSLAASTAPVPDPSAGAPHISGGTEALQASATAPAPAQATAAATTATATVKAQPPEPASDAPPPPDTGHAIAEARLDQQRQALADDGKEMPDAPADDAARSTDAAAAWIAALGLPLPQLPPSPAASTAPVPDPSAGAPHISGGTEALQAPAPATPTPTATATATANTATATVKAQSPEPALNAPPPPDTGRAIAGARLDQRTARPIPTSLATAAIPDALPGPLTAGAVAGASQRDSAFPVSTPTAPSAPALAQSDAFQVSTVPHPAREIFAAAIASAARWPDSARVERDESGIAPALTLDTLPRPAVAATGATHDAPLDLGKEQGLQRLIDRIETLRDDANARDTRIRLVPDALGAVDIAVRTQGEAVHVHFTAERRETQTLLVDAQPRLTELAQQRGVRIAETSVSTGNPNANGGGTTPQPRPNRTPRAPRAPAAAAPADDPATYHRLA